jgi:translation initiation factor IF-1
MPREDNIEVIGTVLEVLPRSACRVALPNGHRVVARAAGRLRLTPVKLSPGDRVKLEMSPFDLSRARIVGLDKG